ncbi:hypothetical protein [Methylobacterium sp. J-076]|uniref:hypothetical protein n=1 Tax=Methylobacterium sp. J-076 TaxID=2836655 RepID=UPI002444B116|nr:hypothetical protein [Methylobacterium sp. J-076]
MHRRPVLLGLAGLLAAATAGCTPREPPQTAQLTPAAHARAPGRAGAGHRIRALHRRPATPRPADAPQAAATPPGAAPLRLRLGRD